MTRLIAIFIPVVIGLGAFFVWFGSQTTIPGANLGAVSAQEAADIDTSGVIEMTMGNPDADVTVIEYASYTCPHCRDFHAGPFKKLKAEYIDTGKINFIYREVYFDRFGLWAGMIARCGGPERYFGFSDLLYTTQTDWARAGEPEQVVEQLRRIGRQGGLTNDELDACLSDGEMAQAMVAVFQENATADGVNSTPSFVIGGSKYSNMPYDELTAILDKELGE